MICQEKLLAALRATHQALIACSACICDCASENECEELRDLTVVLATQADKLNYRLMASYGQVERPNVGSD